MTRTAATAIVTLTHVRTPEVYEPAVVRVAEYDRDTSVVFQYLRAFAVFAATVHGQHRRSGDQENSRVLVLLTKKLLVS